METTAPQIYIFMITLYGGMLAGVAYDIYRCIRRVARKRRWLTVLLDVLFIITLGLIVFMSMYAANEGELRLFTFVGFALGFGLYMAGLSLFFSYLAKRIKRSVNNARTRKKG